MSSFTPLSAAAGGLLIGVAASALLVLNGRIAGISGIVAGALLPEDGERSPRVAFVAGLFAGGLLLLLLHPAAFEITHSTSILLPVAAGLLVGVGVRVGNGCTSGHGVCGIGRLSKRSIVATLVFMGAAMITTFVAKHLFGGAS